MFGWITVLGAFFITSTATFITRDEVEEDALVRFHWSESNKMRNNTKYGADVRRRADALDGQLATIMGPPFGPFWSKNLRRIVIQSLDDPDIILAVKMRNLQLEQPIKIHVFHARNDSSTSDQYFRKWGEFNYAPGIDHAISYEDSYAEVQSLATSHDFVRFISLLPDPVDTARQWMITIKELIGRFLWHKYLNIDSSFSFDDGINMIDSWTRYDDDFRETLKIHYKSIHRHGGIYQEMRWPLNNRISDEWLFQGLDFATWILHDRMRIMLDDALESLETLPTFSIILPLITRMIQDARPEIEYRDMRPSVQGRVTSLVEQKRVGLLSQTEFRRRFLSALKTIPQYVLSGVKRYQEVTMIRRIGETFVTLHPSLSQGNTVAITVPGDIIPKVDRLENFLYRVIKRLGLKYKCKVEVFEV